MSSELFYSFFLVLSLCCCLESFGYFMSLLGIWHSTLVAVVVLIVGVTVLVVTVEMYCSSYSSTAVVISVVTVYFSSGNDV